jgi:glutamate transport system permease protein
VLGTLLALGRLARSFLVRLPAIIFVEFFRGLPLYVLIAFCGYGLPEVGVDLPKFNALVLGLTLYNSAILGEVFRAGILSLDRGQTEASLAIGLGYWQTMLLVVVPQAFRRMVPAIVSQLVTLLKDTSLGVIILVEELLRRSQLSAQFFSNPLQSFLIAALMYIVVCYSLSRLARRLEIRQRRRYSAGAIQVTGLEDLAIVGAEAEAAQVQAQDNA